MDYDPSREPPKEMIGNARGSTNFDQCGWCKYAMGTHRYSYCIEGSCTLKDRGYGEEDEEKRKVRWNTKCFWTSKSQSEIDHEVNTWKYRVREHEESISRAKAAIADLKKLSKKAKYLPDFPDHRSCEHFNIGDKIAVWFPNDILKEQKVPVSKLTKGRWFFGSVENGYRHHDGCVSYKLIGIGPQIKDFWGSGMAVPTVMKYEDYQFFQDHPKEYFEWCKVAYDHKYNGTRMDPVPIDEIEDSVLQLMDKMGYTS